MKPMPWSEARARRLVAAAGGCITSAMSIAATARATHTAAAAQPWPAQVRTAIPTAAERACPAITFFALAAGLFGAAKSMHADEARGAIIIGIPLAYVRYDIRQNPAMVPA
jgi:hypothetical protein